MITHTQQSSENELLKYLSSSRKERIENQFKARRQLDFPMKKISFIELNESSKQNCLYVW